MALYRIVPVRILSSSSLQSAGFQGPKGSNTALNVLQMRIERKKKLVRKLENAELEMKPLKDFNVRFSWKSPERHRIFKQFSADELENRIKLTKQWSAFVLHRKKQEKEKLMQLEKSQENALYELQQESESLFQAAVQVDEDLFPLCMLGPPETPPLKKYRAPLGTVYHWEETYN